VYQYIINEYGMWWRDLSQSSSLWYANITYIAYL